jgi:hypothetical protein
LITNGDGAIPTMNELDKRANRLKLNPRPKQTNSWKHFSIGPKQTDSEKLEHERYTQVRKLLR